MGLRMRWSMLGGELSRVGCSWGDKVRVEEGLGVEGSSRAVDVSTAKATLSTWYKTFWLAINDGLRWDISVRSIIKIFTHISGIHTRAYE